jgi:serine/threonine-protein kinase
MSDKDGVVLVYVPAGTFTMGSQDLSSTGASPHSITLDAFWIDQTEVTNKQYALCVADGGCTLPSDLKSPRRSSYYMDMAFAAYPVIYVEWAQAEAYCKWAGRQLPTEAQWEKAARGTDGRMYPWGDAAPHDTLLNYNSTSRDTTQVKSYPDGVSVYGAYDMAGNVWEWVHDLYDDNYYQYSPSLNPLGPNEPGVYTPLARSLRGGSWYYEEGSPRSIFRYGVVPVEYLVRSDVRSWAVARYQDTSVYGRPPLGFGTVGFRCAMNVTP